MNTHVMKSNKLICCSNCAKIGHYYKNCNEPIISLGIIIVKIDDEIKKLFINGNYPSKMALLKTLENGNFNVLTNKQFINKSIINLFQDKIKFLLIRRKHTFNYITFVNGKYEYDDMPQLAMMFKYMTNEEILKIKTKEFDVLWSDVWSRFNIDQTHHNYEISKMKWNQLKKQSKFNLQFFTDNIKSEYDYPEWGIPKGKRNSYESDEECATREVYEETGLKNTEYNLISNINSITENILKFNGIAYKYKYYIGIYENGNLMNENEMENNGEIGDIGWFSINEINQLIRPYYKQRIKILQKLYYFIIDKLINRH